MATGFNLHRFANPGRFLRLAGALLRGQAEGVEILRGDAVVVEAGGSDVRPHAAMTTIAALNAATAKRQTQLCVMPGL